VIFGVKIASQACLAPIRRSRQSIRHDYYIGRPNYFFIVILLLKGKKSAYGKENTFIYQEIVYQVDKIGIICLNS